MKRARIFLALAGVVLLGIGAWMIDAHRGPMQMRMISGPTCQIPATVLLPERAVAEGSVIVFHGLASNRKLMLTLGQQFAAAGLRVYLLDLPGHGNNTQPFSFARVEDCAAEAVDVLFQRGELRYDRTILVGHSMGGAIAIRMADRFPTAATIAISPAPMVQVGWLRPNGILYSPPHRMPINLLILAGGLEPSAVVEADQVLLRNAGGERSSPEDFLQSRAVQLVIVPGASHAGLVFDPRVIRRSVAWAQEALNDALTIAQGTAYALAGSLIGLLGLILCCPLVLASVVHILRAGESHSEESDGAIELRSNSRTSSSVWITLLCWTGVSIGVVLVLQFWVPLRLVRIHTGDYYASFKLLAGIVLLLALSKSRLPEIHVSLRSILAAACLAALFTLVLGAWLNWQITDLWMNAARWARFFPIVLAGYPFYLAEELALGPPEKKPTRRWLLFILLRLIPWGAMVGALLLFQNEQLLILLLGTFLAMIAIPQRLGANAIRRRTGSAAAAALYSAILGAWFLAAVLPLT